MELNSIQNLLTQVSLISKKYDEIAKHTGENYNVFSVIGKDYDELCHSKIIADLLNPKGLHGLNEIFLEIFLKTVNYKGFDSKNAKIEIEKNIGNKNENATEGGRIDIYISDGKNEIIIENKIYADDQPNQLERYHNAYPNATIYYLTIWGKNPSEKSLGKLNESSIICLSYSQDITNWLEQSLNYTYRFPFLRETLNQYLYLIRKLTEQSMNEDMENEIIELLKSGDNFKSAQLIKTAIDSLISESEANLIPTLEKHFDYIISKEMVVGEYRYYFLFDKEGLKPCFNLGIKKNAIFGIVNSDEVAISLNKSIKQKFPESKSNSNYIAWLEFDIDVIKFYTNADYQHSTIQKIKEKIEDLSNYYLSIISKN